MDISPGEICVACLLSYREELGKDLSLTMVLSPTHSIATDNQWAYKRYQLISLCLKESRGSYSGSVRLFGKDTSSLHLQLCHLQCRLVVTRWLPEGKVLVLHITPTGRKMASSL